MSGMFEKLNGLLEGIKLDDVTSEKTGDYPTLPEGYFLAEVKKAELKESKSSGNPMASFTLETVEDGIDVVFEDDDIKYIALPKTKKITTFKHFVLKDEASIKRFVSDMLKFEDGDGNPYLPKEAFLNGELVEQAIESLEGMRIYIQVTITEKEDNTKSTWINFISWKRSNDLGLPM